MDNRFKLLSAGLITGAVFIVFLYSPLGSPDLYRNASLFTVATKPGVNFNGKVGHSFSSRTGSANYQQNLGLDATVNNQEKHTISIQNLNSSSESFEQNSGSAGAVYTSTHSTFKPTGGGGFMLVGGASRSSSGRSSTNSFSGKGHGFIALSADLSSTATTPTTRQFAPDAEPLGGPDPGGDPEEPAIPVSNGLLFMLLLALGYFLKRVYSR